MQGLLACARGELFGEGNARLPLPPMLMFDRITRISELAAATRRAKSRPKWKSSPDLWFFKCHFQNDP